MIKRFSILKPNCVCTFTFCIVLNFKHLWIKQKAKEQTIFLIFLAYKILNFGAKK